MSDKATHWVWNHARARGTAQHVLLRLADRADSDTWECWPGFASLSKDTGYGVNTVQRAIVQLELLGDIEILRKGVGDRSSLYRVNPKRSPQNGDTHSPQNGARVPPKPSKRSPQNGGLTNKRTNQEPRGCARCGKPIVPPQSQIDRGNGPEHLHTEDCQVPS